jgi:hypothetical protein
MKYAILLAAMCCLSAQANETSAQFTVSATVPKRTEIVHVAQPHELWVSQAAIDNGRLDTIGVYYRVKRNHTDPFQIVFLPLAGQPAAITINGKIEVGVVDTPVYVTIESPYKETVVMVQYTFILPSLYMPRPDIYEFPIEVTVE